ARIGDGGDDSFSQRAPFLAALHRGLTGLIEFRALPSRTKAFVPPGDDGQVEQFVADHAHEHVFVGVATRIDQTSGALSNCRHLRAIWIDFDVKNAPKTALEKSLHTFPLKPSAAVSTGGGWHLYWMLREALDLQVPADRACVSRLLRRLAQT